MATTEEEKKDQLKKQVRKSLEEGGRIVPTIAQSLIREGMEKGHKKSVVLKVTDFERMQEELEDLEDAPALGKARKDATGFKKWQDFLKQVDAKKT
jgi:hypothetical protein